jgi:hypothetical protein
MENELENISDPYFQRVWSIMKETYESERHFNNLETQYRILASQWLLGAFAAIGFVFISDLHLPFDKLWLVVAICVISGVGIFQLWRMDIVIYQRLLGAVFNIGLELEEKFKFLPKIKNRMKDSVPNKNVTDVLFYYYYITILFFALVGLAATFYLLKEKITTAILVSALVVSIILLGLLHRYMCKGSKEK